MLQLNYDALFGTSITSIKDHEVRIIGTKSKDMVNSILKPFETQIKVNNNYKSQSNKIINARQKRFTDHRNRIR